MRQGKVGLSAAGLYVGDYRGRNTVYVLKPYSRGNVRGSQGLGYTSFLGSD